MVQNLHIEGADYSQVDIKKISKDLEAKAPLTTFGFQTMDKEPTSNNPPSFQGGGATLRGAGVVSHSEHWITISTTEFTAICPFSDYPDFGTVTITYVPTDRCLELKSFKLYINAFRDIKIFHESVTELIFADFLKTVVPKKATILVDMNVRGNIKTVCKKYFNCTKTDVEL